MGRDHVSELWPPTGLLFIPADDDMESHGGMMILTRETEELGEILSECHFVHHKSHMD
jgi:hypothetical protein